MDLNSNKFMEPSTRISSQGMGATLEINRGRCYPKTSPRDPFLNSISDPICKMNLKETSEFVKSFPGANHFVPESTTKFLEIPRQSDNNGVKVNLVLRSDVEAPPTPGRPIFSFSHGIGNFSRKGFPSKWEDAEKWLSRHESPSYNSHGLEKSLESSKVPTKQCTHKDEIFPQKSRVFEGYFSEGPTAKPEYLLKDKFPNEVNPIINPKFGCSDPMQEGFLFGNTVNKSMNNATTATVKHRDIGTEMTPLGSSTTSQCPTPFKSVSPARHNTPADRSGPLAIASIDGVNTIDITQMEGCNLDNLHIGAQFDSNMLNWCWEEEEEEEEDISKSLRHSEMSSELKSCVWEEEEKTKSCLRYRREAAKIQAWVNLQRAKAEAESRKLEVKIQKMRSNMEEKVMKRMAGVHRKAEEWREAAQYQHSEQIQKIRKHAHKVRDRNNSYLSGQRRKSCACFPCGNHHV